MKADIPARRRPQIKICCIASAAEAELAIACGADILGLVSAMPSGPGVIDEDRIAAILAQVRGRARTFLLVSAQRWQPLLELHQRCPADALQLVDAVPIEDLQALRRHLPQTTLVQVIHVRDASAVDEALAIAPWVDAILLDSGNPNAAIKELGGTGRLHDWRISRQIRDRLDIPVYLAGGLSPITPMQRSPPLPRQVSMFAPACAETVCSMPTSCAASSPQPGVDA